jgi:glucose/arabinose dehydrogenase
MKRLVVLMLILLLAKSCSWKEKDSDNHNTAVSFVPNDSLPKPYSTKSVKNYSKVVGWPDFRTPIAPSGFRVSKYADGFKNPRWIYVAPNGDILVAEANTELKGFQKIAAKLNGKGKSQHTGNSANQITLLRDHDKDGLPEVRQVLVSNLNQPLGMLVIGNSLYIANTDGIISYPYQAGQTEIKSEGRKIIDLPAGGYNNHWTRNIITNKAKTKIYVSVGSGSDHGENGMANEILRANILEINLDGSGERVFASGLRNPFGMAWAPGTQDLWAVVNERDELGDELVPDFLTHVKPGAFYGWPYAYFGPHADPRLKGDRPDLIAQSIIPDVKLDAHSSSMGLAFYNKKSFPPKYRGGAFIGQHGSWNRSVLSGYKVVFVPFKKGKPVGEPEDFLTGFIANSEKSEVFGRPAGIAVLPDGSLLVADDASNTLWKIEVEKNKEP